MAVPLWRFILVYILSAFICAILIFISYNILKRDIKDRLNQFLSSFFLFIVFSFINNFIYASISDPSLEYIVTFLHILSVYFITVASGFLLLFIILLYNPESKFSSTKYQILFLIIYNMIGIGSFFIPDGVKIKILQDGTQLYPVWNLFFFLYYLCIMTTTMILSLIISKKIYDKFKVKILARRMKLFVLGICCIYYIGFAVGLINYLNVPILRIILTLTQAIPIIGVILIYYSIGRTLKHPFENYVNQN